MASGLSRWDYWPLLRLALVAVFFSAFACLRLGWAPLETLRKAPGAALVAFETFSLLCVFSSLLSRIYVEVLFLPLAAVAYLNDWFYEVPRALFLKLIGSGRLSAGLAFGAELVLFAAAGYGLRMLAPYARF